MTITTARKSSAGSGIARVEVTLLDAATHPEVMAFIDHWRSCARDSLPSRADFEPRRIARWLPYFVVMELKGGQVHYRLVGSRLEARAETSAQGRFVSEIFSPDSAEVSLALFGKTIEGAAPLVLRLRFKGLPVEFLDFEAVQAPILAPDGQDKWVVGCLYPIDELNTSPGLPLR